MIGLYLSPWNKMLMSVSLGVRL